MQKILFAAFLSIFLINAWSADEGETNGSINAIQYTPDNNTIHIEGWTWDSSNKKSADAFEVSTQGQKATISINQKITQDGNKENNSEKLFSISANFPKYLKGGLSEVKIEAKFSHEKAIILKTQDNNTPSIHIPQIYTRHWILLAAIFATIFFCATKKYSQHEKKISVWFEKNKQKTAISLVFTFFLLVATGVTGSSIRIFLEGPFGNAAIEAQGNNKKIFKTQAIRGDEWGVLMPNTIAQINHEPKFPIINKNIGIEGQNMGVIGMTGVPIAQWSIIARPATWGYFFLPLRNALAWHWQLPFWSCLLALWWLMNLIKPEFIGRNFALSFTFCIAPYAAAWSNWPLYFTLFPCLAMAAAIKIAQSREWKHSISWALLLGYSVSAWILTLYPPWIVTTGTLIALIMAGWLIDNRKSLVIGKHQFTSIFLAGAAVATIVGSWWLDTHEAVSALQNTVYPGQRTLLTGGDNGFLWAFRGYTNLESLTFGTGPWTNQSEISSYFWLPAITVWLCIAGMTKEKKNRWIVCGCTAFILFHCCFLFLGIPSWLAKITQWGRVPTNRGDLAMGLAFFVMLSLTSTDWFKIPTSKTSKYKNQILLALSITISVWLIQKELFEIPIQAFPKNSIIYAASVVFIGTFITFWISKNQIGKSITLLWMAFFLSTAGFNPLSQAPKNLSPEKSTKELASDATGIPQRTLVIGGDGLGPQTLAAAGIPTINGILYYPHKELWKKIELPKEEWKTVNRYQHLGFSTGTPLNGKNYSVSSAAMDQVSVTIDPIEFDFGKTGAKRVAALEDQAIALRQSSKLYEIGSYKGLVWFAVR